jgi:predicted Zn-dependent peptidase
MKSEFITINNYNIVLNLNKSSKTTMVETFISNGTIHENKDNAGISHLLEHIVTEGWKKCGSKPCSDYWKKKGVITNASTGLTNVRYYMEGLEKYTLEMLDYIVSISTNPIITKSRVNKEKKAVTNELLIHSSQPFNELYDLTNKMLFKISGLVYQDDTKLQIKNLKHITEDNLRHWAKKFYGAGNIVILVTGKFNKAKVISLLKKKLNKTNTVRVIPKFSDIFKQGLDVQYVKNKSLDNTNIVFTFHSPLYQKDPEIFFIDFFKEFIGSGISSMLMEELREKKKLIYSIDVESNTLPYGTFLSIFISTKNKHIREVVTNTIKILKQLINGRFTNEYMDYIKKTYLVKYYSTCFNNNYLSDFYGMQHINQIYSDEKSVILSLEDVRKNILDLSKITFILFVKRLIILSNIKIGYQGKTEVKNLQNIVLKSI